VRAITAPSTAGQPLARRSAINCAQHKVPLPAAALQFLLAHPAIASHVPGTRTVQQMEQNIAWVSHPIPAAFWQDLKLSGLLRQDAPTP
jgi:D-threo-aldose 1-dehydrogenase